MLHENQELLQKFPTSIARPVIITVFNLFTVLPQGGLIFLVSSKIITNKKTITLVFYFCHHESKKFKKSEFMGDRGLR